VKNEKLSVLRKTNSGKEPEPRANQKKKGHLNKKKKYKHMDRAKDGGTGSRGGKTNFHDWKIQRRETEKNKKKKRSGFGKK